jgi:hypothetical protein
VLTTKKADSLADFSLSPLFRRQWSSTYDWSLDYDKITQSPFWVGMLVN